MGTLKLSDFWLSRVPTKTKATQMILDQRLFSLQLRMVTLKLSDFWMSLVPIKDQGATDDGITPLFIAADEGPLEVVRFLVESGANKRPRHYRQWTNASLLSSSWGAPWRCPMSRQETECWRLAEKMVETLFFFCVCWCICCCFCCYCCCCSCCWWCCCCCCCCFYCSCFSCCCCCCCCCCCSCCSCCCCCCCCCCYCCCCCCCCCCCRAFPRQDGLSGMEL